MTTSASTEQPLLRTHLNNTILPKQLHPLVYIRIFSVVGPNSFVIRPTIPTPDPKHDDWEGHSDVFGKNSASVPLCPTQTPHILSWDSNLWLI
jgi:hypothetical protein